MEQVLSMGVMKANSFRMILHSSIILELIRKHRRYSHMKRRHSLDIHPAPEDKDVLSINEAENKIDKKCIV